MPTTPLDCDATGAGGADGATPEAGLMYNSLLGEPVPGEKTFPVEAKFTKPDMTCDAENVGLRDQNTAAAPATCGAAIDVPLM